MLDGGATADTKIDSRGAKEIIDILPKEEVSTVSTYVRADYFIHILPHFFFIQFTTFYFIYISVKGIELEIQRHRNIYCRNNDRNERCL